VIGAGIGEIIPVVPNERLEPKTFFANERTYVSYLKSCLVVIVGCFTLVSMQKLAAMVIGIVFICLAALMTFYAVWRYHWRRKLIRQGNPDVALDDNVGPILISVLMIAFLLTLFIYFMANPPRFNIRAHSPPLPPAVC